MSDLTDPPDGQDPGFSAADAVGVPAGEPADLAVAGTLTAMPAAGAAREAGTTQEPETAKKHHRAAPTQSAGAASAGPSAVQLALEAGWTMAVLYRIALRPPGTRPEHPGELLTLPTANELRLSDRWKLELARLRDLLTRLAATPELADPVTRELADPGTREVADPATPELAGPARPRLPVDLPPTGPDVALPEALVALNLDILCALAAARPATQLAYQLGRSLRDTADPPDEHRPARALADEFARDRVTTIQGWLDTLASEFPRQAAAVVAASLGRWSEFAAVVVSETTPRLANGDSATVFDAVYSYLLRQGDHWLMLLTGERPTSGLLSPEGFVAAGELALRRSAAIVLRILRRYWGALAVGVIALGAMLTLAAIYAGGAAKAWTSIAAIAGSLGISARAIASASARLAADAEQPIFAAAQEDVMAWAITTMPEMRLNRAGVWQLRKAGIARTSSLGRV